MFATCPATAPWAECNLVLIRRPLIHAGVLGLTGLALAGVIRTATPTAAPSVPAAAPAAVAASGGAARWSVKVDGWTIELDRVAGLAFPATSTPVTELPSLLSPYDQMIARHAEAAGFDWRFVAALIYEESRFDPQSVSDAGAYGLMQVMPAAAQDVGELRFREPEANVRTGVRYLQRLERECQPARDRNRHALMLAAYNMGIGHLRDAQALAGRFGYDPWRWDGAMDVMVSLLEEPQVAEQLPNGFAQGRAVVAYVDRVLERYGAYRRQLPPSLARAGETAQAAPPKRAGG